MTHRNSEREVTRRGALTGIAGGLGAVALGVRGGTDVVRGTDHVDVPSGEIRTQSYSHDLESTFVNRGTFEVYE